MEHQHRETALAQQHIRRIVTVVARHHAIDPQWTLAGTSEGVELVWRQAAKERRLLFAPRHEGKSYATSASCSVSICSDSHIERLSPAVESFLRTLMELLRRTDEGDWAFPNVAPKRVRSTWAGRDSDSARQAHIDLAESLHFGSYVAWRAVTSTDLYPHINPLGDPVTGETLRDSWKKTLAQRRAGKGAPKLGLYVHVPYCTVACTFCYCGKTDRFTRGDFETYLSRLSEEIRFFCPSVR